MFLDLDLLLLPMKGNKNITIQMIKKLLLTLLLSASLPAAAQNDVKEREDFRAYLFNNEYQVYLRINLYDQDVQVPGQDLYGPLPGYLGKQHNSFSWVITSCQIDNEQRKATLQLINDFGSEDLVATLQRQNDTLYLLHQGAGSTIKVPHQGKWRKLPKTLYFIRKR